MEAPRGPWTFVADAWIGGPTGKSEVEIDVVDEADSALRHEEVDARAKRDARVHQREDEATWR